MAAIFSAASTHRGGVPAHQASTPKAAQPAGTFLPGTKVQVGSHRVTIEKYLSEGGFAHVYVVRIPRDSGKHELAVLKRVAVPDRDHLASMRTEVETMKKLKGHRRVVMYMDSHASQLKGDGYEVFLLMEYCSGGGLIDFMNTRLQHRLTEPEILKIFGDVAEGVACMHYLKPPLLHRDLKVENVLISKSGGSGTPTYKLCDFGSAAVPRPAAKTAEEGRLIEEDVQKHTTMQYRSPEMLDVWRKQPIDEKSDIWALGVLLYKLCYYTTPFEDVGQMAILNASYKFPSHPAFSDRLKKLIAWTLKEDPKHRPNIYQVIKEVCSMRGTEVPIKDIYADRTESESRRNERLPELARPTPSLQVGLQKTTPQVQVQSIPDITPGRRGRPTGSTQQAPAAAKPSPSPARGDPFAALDSKNFDVRVDAVGEISKRFPSLDDFAIAHDTSGHFGVVPQKSAQPVDTSKSDLNERVAIALADEAFAPSKPRSDIHKSQSAGQLQQPHSSTTKPAVAAKVRDFSQLSPLVQQSLSVRPNSKYKSTGVGSSPPLPSAKLRPEANQKPIWRVPSHHRSSSQPRATDDAQGTDDKLQTNISSSKQPVSIDVQRSKLQTSTPQTAKAPSSASSRPSLESGRPTYLELADSSTSRTKSAQNRSRPTSMYTSSNLDYLRNQESSGRKLPSFDLRRRSQQLNDDQELLDDDLNIENDIDFLHNNEEGDNARKPSGKGPFHGHHKKRSSLGSSISGAKNLLSGRFGDAFKRFEPSPGDDERDHADAGRVTLEPRGDYGAGHRLGLSPVAGSENTPSKYSDPGSAIDETEDLPPDVRRELERSRLNQEERRVAEAAAEHRARATTQGSGGAAASTRASTIQKRVQSLLDEGRQSPELKRTAEGYGKYTEEEKQSPQADASPVKSGAPTAMHNPAARPESDHNPFPQTRNAPPKNLPTSTTTSNMPDASISEPSTQSPAQHLTRQLSRPSVPPKSQALRTGGSARSAQRPAQQPISNPETALSPKSTGGLAALLAKDLEGVPDYPSRGSPAEVASGANVRATSPADLDGELQADFSKRYPSLSGLEMVEMELNGGHERPMRIKDV